MTYIEERDAAALFQWIAATLAGDDPRDGWSEVAAATVPAPVAQHLRSLDRLLAQGREEVVLKREAERVRLFEAAPGGVPVPPYGSWWLEGCVGGETCRAVADYYLEEGLEPGSAPADYLPAELELVQLLLRHQRAGMVTGQLEAVASAVQREREFIESFLLPWLPELCTAGRQASSDPFWLAIFDLLATLVHHEHMRLTVAA